MVPALDAVAAGVAVARLRGSGVAAGRAAAEAVVLGLLVYGVVGEANLVVGAEVKAGNAVVGAHFLVERYNDARVAALDKKLKEDGPEA